MGEFRRILARAKHVNRMSQGITYIEGIVCWRDVIGGVIVLLSYHTGIGAYHVEELTKLP